MEHEGMMRLVSGPKVRMLYYYYEYCYFILSYFV